jgi:hypothetical protein
MTKHPAALVALANRLKLSVEQLKAFADAQGLTPAAYVKQTEAGLDRMKVPATCTDDDLLSFLD